MSALGDKDFAEIFFCFDAMNHSGQRGRIWCLAEHGSGSQGQDRGEKCYPSQMCIVSRKDGFQIKDNPFSM